MTIFSTIIYSSGTLFLALIGIIIFLILSAIMLGTICVFILIPVGIVNLIRGRKQIRHFRIDKQVLLGLTVLGLLLSVFCLFGVELLKIFVPAILEICTIVPFIGFLLALFASVILSIPIYLLIDRKLILKKDDLASRIAEADLSCNFDEMDRLKLEETKLDAKTGRHLSWCVGTAMAVSCILFAIFVWASPTPETENLGKGNHTTIADRFMDEADYRIFYSTEHEARVVTKRQLTLQQAIDLYARITDKQPYIRIHFHVPGKDKGGEEYASVHKEVIFYRDEETGLFTPHYYKD